MMPEALRRGRIGDPVLTSAILVAVTVLHFALLRTDGSRRFNNETFRTAFEILLITSWPLLLIGSMPLIYFWFLDRSIDKQYFSTASQRQMAVIMLSIASIILGNILLFIAFAFWTADVGVERFHVVIIFGFLLLALLLWIVVQMCVVVREANAVRMHLKNSPRNVEQNHEASSARSDVPLQFDESH